MQRISETDLILNADGSIYHLNLLPGDVAHTVITVGDPDRVGDVSQHFDTIEFKKGKREFITHTGSMSGMRITVISTGIGTDNIDIVLNELDALVNIDFKTRLINPKLKRLNIIRIGTSGAIQADIAVDSLLVSEAAFGLDVLMHYYEQHLTVEQKEMLSKFQTILPAEYRLKPYFSPASTILLQALAPDLSHGITITAPGFYAPQGRQVRAKTSTPGFMNSIQQFSYLGKRITNLEMETAGIYSLANALGHHALSFNVILVNRTNHVFSKNPGGIMEKFIEQILHRVVNLKLY